LIIYSLISINLIESIVRPQLTKNGTGLHPLMILLSSIGGLIVFANPLGLLYGQLIAVFYKTVISVYQEKYNAS
jgi:predicted PurR-regulated permease PerM